MVRKVSQITELNPMNPISSSSRCLL